MACGNIHILKVPCASAYPRWAESDGCGLFRDVRDLITHLSLAGASSVTNDLLRLSFTTLPQGPVAFYNNNRHTLDMFIADRYTASWTMTHVSCVDSAQSLCPR